MTSSARTGKEIPKMAGPQRLSCGLDHTFSHDINATVEASCKCGYDFLCVPLFHPRFQREFIEGPAKERAGPVTRSDMLLTSQDWSSLVVGKTSEWIQVDSENEVVRKNSEMAFKQELNFSSHLSVPAILIPVTGPLCCNLARILCEHILTGHNHQFWLRIPLKAPGDDCDDVIEHGCGDTETGSPPFTQDTWTWWNTVRMLCDSNKKIGVALEMSEDLPQPDVIARWCGEPVKAIIIPTHIFLTNKKGFPVLSRGHQALLRLMYKLDVQLIVSGFSRHGDRYMRLYQQYLDHLWQVCKSQEPPDCVAAFAKGYEDYLQCPLQPLMDNLESQTYEVFEKDPVKYSQYQKAVYFALLDKVPDEEKDTKVVIVMVLGAGRGPLVKASLNAASKAERRIKVYAVEKNPNAVVTLENLKYEVWGDQVTVVSSDMRFWEAPEKADIIVSELLGSFGDNELSPECLDGAQKFLKDDGISIPRKYTSFLAPLSSSKLWNEARICKVDQKPPEAPFETPYVVRLHNVHVLDKPQPVFTFHHPNRGVIDNSRYKSFDFHSQVDALVHGFAGYFDCVLYGDVTLSIVPETHSPEMFSWFPIYIPLKDPIFLKKDELLQLQFWRLCSQKNVWYEWCITAPSPRPIHNPKGRSYTIGL